MRDWVGLFDEPRPFTFWLSLINYCKFVPAGKLRELEVYTVYQRLQATPKDISGYCACLYHTRCVAKLSE